MVKAPEEIEYLRLAGLSAVAGVRELTKEIRPGMEVREMEII
jgi:Xaa-Pro aminopeptidase